ncbi:MAG: ABC transporter ATP-binding protein [Deltaproteobacteria bacterium]|nr:ABC transporter ATP-binding protein [Deltaproteobacteria bacterium]MBW2069896.1 ABC transporter ATP-binding protein [Deltaproteobacteria bacterium]
MLRLKSVHTYYGKIHALKGVSLHVRPGEIVTLIGANGAGKTTLLKTISGLIRASRGTIEFNGEDLSKMSAEQIVRRGISHVPEGRKLFGTLSVRDNLEMGAFIRGDKEEIGADLSRIREKFPILSERWEQMAGTLSGGEQQIVAITRALMAKPTLLILDEPSMGLSPLLTKEIFHIILRLREEGTTILLVEQNARAALHVADRGYVLETGRIVLQGKCKMLLEHNEVRRAYLGKGYRQVWEE